MPLVYWVMLLYLAMLLLPLPSFRPPHNAGHTATGQRAAVREPCRPMLHTAAVEPAASFAAAAAAAAAAGGTDTSCCCCCCRPWPLLPTSNAGRDAEQLCQRIWLLKHQHTEGKCEEAAGAAEDSVGGHTCQRK